MLYEAMDRSNVYKDQDVAPMKCQVGGHTFRDGKKKSLGLLTLKGGFILKPITDHKKGKREVAFYESLLEPWDETAKELKNFVPSYYGTRQHLIGAESVEWIVLEDLSRGFSEPCIMDVKIGRQTWDPDAPMEKIHCEQVKYVASKRELGLCIPGYQVYDLSSGQLRHFDSSHGKSLDGAGVRDAIRTFLNGNTAFSRLLLLQLLAKLWQILRWFRRQTHYHIFGSSLLLVYDAAKLRDNLSSHLRTSSTEAHRPTVARQLSLRTPTGPLTPGFDAKRPVSLRIPPGTSGSPSSSRPSTPSPADLTDEFDTMCKTHSLDNNYERDLASMRENYSVVLKDLLHDRAEYESWVHVKMIDFAHVFPASSIDKNYLDGLENLVNILEQFLVEVD